MTKKESVIVLLSITLCWSSSYVFIKAVPEDFTVYSYLALTSGTAALLISILCWKRLRLLTRKALWQGVILGLLITGNMTLEKLGLDHLPASSVSALEALNIIIVPIILMLRKKFPTRNNVAGILLIFAGILISSYVSMSGSGLLGILFIVVSCVMMSLYTILATEYTKETDPMLLTILQLAVTAVTGFILWAATDPGSLTRISWSQETLSYIFILAFFSKAYAYTMLMYADKYADAISVTVIAALDPVVTLFMAIIIPTEGTAEIFTFRSLLGAVVITAGAIVAGTNFLTPREKRAAEGPPEEKKPEPAAVRKEAAEQRLSGRQRRRIMALAFAGIVALFAVLAVSIDVMDMADGYTNLRPENCLSVPAGIMLGPLGALACALGNLIADFFEDYNEIRIIGFIANFILAYLPYKVWRTLSPGKYNVHTWKRILLYLWAAALGCLYCSCLLGVCLAYLYHEYYEIISLQIFANNFGFATCFGLPLFIVLRSDDRIGLMWLGTMAELNGMFPRRIDPRSRLAPGRRHLISWMLIVADTAIVGTLFLCTAYMQRWWENPFVTVLSVLAGVLLLVTCLFPSGVERMSEAELSVQ